MKRYTITLLFLFLAINIENYASEIVVKSASVISNAGNSYVSDSLLIDWTIGESIIFTSETNSEIVSQGFQQPMVCKVIPTIIATNETSCELPLKLTVSDYFSYFQWQLGNRVIVNHTDFSYNPVSNGLHKVTVGDSLGCLLTSKAVAVDMSYKIHIPTINLMKSENFDTVLIASEASSYQWYLHDTVANKSQIIVDATKKSYTPEVSGTYFVKINTDNFCASNSSMFVVEFSETKNLDDVELTKYSNINPNNESKVIVFPNPCRNNYFVEYYSTKIASITIELSDVNGAFIYANQFLSNQVKTTSQFNCDNLAKGTYLLKITNEKSTIVKKLIIE